MTNTEERVCRLVAHDLGIIQSEVALTSRLHQDLRADNLDLVAITMSLEETFGIIITDEEMDRINVVSDAVTIVDAALAAKVAA